MTRLLPACLGALCIGACATTDIPSALTTAAPAVPAQTATVDEPEMAASSTQTGAEAEIEVIDIPAVEEAAIPAAVSKGDDRICRREVRTGTHRAVRVCRTRAEIERMEQESKDTFRDLHESQRLQDQAEQKRRQ